MCIWSMPEKISSQRPLSAHAGHRICLVAVLDILSQTRAAVPAHFLVRPGLR